MKDVKTVYYWVLGAGYWVLGAGYWVLGAGCSAYAKASADEVVAACRRQGFDG